MWALIFVNGVVSGSIRISLYFLKLPVVFFFYFWSQTHGVRAGKESAKKAIGFIEVRDGSFFFFSFWLNYELWQKLELITIG
jgi:hypothetical protein